MTDTELVTVEGAWNFQYRYFAGETASRRTPPRIVIE